MAYTGSVQEYTTLSPYTVGAHEPVAAARDLMRRHDIRHLPVLDDGKLVGVVSERDVKCVDLLPPKELSLVRVSDVMTPDPFIASPTAPLTQTAREMGENRYGCAVVMERDRVIGILTTTDALFALADALSGKAVRPTYEQEAADAPPRGQTRPVTPPLGSRRSGQ